MGKLAESTQASVAASLAVCVCVVLGWGTVLPSRSHWGWGGHSVGAGCSMQDRTPRGAVTWPPTSAVTGPQGTQSQAETASEVGATACMCVPMAWSMVKTDQAGSSAAQGPLGFALEAPALQGCPISPETAGSCCCGWAEWRSWVVRARSGRVGLVPAALPHRAPIPCPGPPRCRHVPLGTMFTLTLALSTPGFNRFSPLQEGEAGTAPKLAPSLLQLAFLGCWAVAFLP